MPSVAADIAVLKSQMAELTANVKEVSVKLDGQGTMFLPRSEWDTWKKGQNYQKMFLMLITAVFTAAITAFIEYAFIGHR